MSILGRQLLLELCITLVINKLYRVLFAEQPSRRDTKLKLL